MENHGQTRHLKEDGDAGLPQQQQACSRLQMNILHSEEQCSLSPWVPCAWFCTSKLSVHAENVPTVNQPCSLHSWGSGSPLREFLLLLLKKNIK